MVVGRYPPSLRTRSLLNTPKAPEIIISIFREDQHIRSTRKARRYSTTWILPNQVEHSSEPGVPKPGAPSRFPTSTTPLEATPRPGSLATGPITFSPTPHPPVESPSTPPLPHCTPSPSP